MSDPWDGIEFPPGEPLELPEPPSIYEFVAILRKGANAMYHLPQRSKKHGCKRCGCLRYEETMKGSLFGFAKNRATCTDCGYKWIIYT